MRRAITLAMAIWAVGVAVSEPVAQAGAGLALLLCLVLWVRGGLKLPSEVRPFAIASLALAGWQAVSPAAMLLIGTADRWPRESRYLQFLDTLAPVSLAALASVCMPWLLVGGLLAGGWLIGVAAGVHQHFVPWFVETPSFLRLSPGRVREVMVAGESPRHAAGGLFFHRLRFAHGALAVMGPALSLASRTSVSWQRWAAGGMVVVLLAAIYVSFARAAMVAAVVVLAAAALWFLQGRLRVLLLAGLVLAAAVVQVMPGWRARAAGAVAEMVSGPRRIALEAGLQVIEQHPVLGVGFGNYAPAALSQTEVRGLTPLTATSPHNLWLMTWAETGLPGLALTILFHATLAWVLWRRARSGHRFAAGGLLAFVGYHVLSFSHYLPFHPATALAFALVFGLGLAPTPPERFFLGRSASPRKLRPTEAAILADRRRVPPGFDGPSSVARTRDRSHR